MRASDSLVESGINQLYARCVDAVWRWDYAAFGRCFAPDAHWDILGFHFRGRVEIARGLAELSRDNARVLLSLGIPLLTIECGVVHGRTLLTELVKRKDGGGAATIGVYHEHYTLRRDRWLFQSRRFEMHYFGPTDFAADLWPASDNLAPAIQR